MKKDLKVFLILACVLVLLCGCSNTANSDDNENSTNNGSESYATKITDTEGGTLYSIRDNVNPDIVMGDNYFDTQIADFYNNFNSYKGKIVEIEGFVLNNYPYTFCGRYSESQLCPNCPVGYSYFEYEWHGDEKLEFEDETTWVKIKGELKEGNDGESYYYIDAYNIEVMDEWGKVPTVVN